MKTITVAELRQNPTLALDEVALGATYLVTKHRHPVAKLVPADSVAEHPLITPARDLAPSNLASRRRRHSYEETQQLLAEMAADR